MAERIDLMVGQIRGGFPSAYNSVTVNAAVNVVRFDVLAAPWDWIFVQPITGASRFVGRDNFRILSYGLLMPHGLSVANVGESPVGVGVVGQTSMRIRAGFFGGAQYELSAFLHMTLPWGDYEVAADIFSDWQPGTVTRTDSMQLHCRLTEGVVSMVGVNAAIDTLTLYPIPFIKVLHTSALVV